jgi:hypothetical protein
MVRDLLSFRETPKIYQIKENRVGGTRGTIRRGVGSIEGFGGKAKRKEATWKTKAEMERWDQNGP